MVSLAGGSWKLHDGGRALAIHGRDPQREADAQAAQWLDGRDTDLLVAIGLGLGFLLDALDRRGWQGRVLALEPEPETVAPMLARRDWSAWLEHDRLRILKAPDFDGATDCWRWFGDGATPPPVFVHPVLERARPAAVAGARRVLDRIQFDARANADARRLHGGRYLLNTLRNLPAIAREPGVACLANAAPHAAAVVVAAGPGLDAALPYLRDVQHSAIVIAVDTALRPLLHAGVTPHLVVAVDPTEANGRHLTDLPHCPDTHLVAEASLEPLALQAFGGRTFLFTVSDHQPWPWLRASGREPSRLSAWGSVLTTAFDLALTMGCDPVVFAGADLAYTGGRPYCRGVSFEEDWRRLAHWGEPIDRQFAETMARHAAAEEIDVHGAPARTAAHLVAFRNWLVEQMAAQQGRRFLNATGSGILRGGPIEQVSPEALPARLPAPDPALRRIVRDRYRPQAPQPVEAAARALLDGLAAGEPAAAPVLQAWEAFAPGITREAVITQLHAAAREFHEEGRQQEEGGRTKEVGGRGADVAAGLQAREPSHYAELGFEAGWLQQLAGAMPLVPLHIPPHRMQMAPSGARVFRFRTIAARIICCALRPQDGAIAEDGHPLARAADLDHVVPGTYSLCRDEVHFRPADDTDPRRNGRTYTLLVPPPVAYVESLPLQEVIEKDV